MERTEMSGKDIILHRDMTQEERDKELERLKEENKDLKEWEE